MAFWKVNTLNNDTLIVSQLLEDISSQCCHQTVRLEVTRDAKHPRDLEENFNEEEEHLVVPVVRTVSRTQFLSGQESHKFVAALESPGLFWSIACKIHVTLSSNSGTQCSPKESNHPKAIFPLVQSVCRIR